MKKIVLISLAILMAVPSWGQTGVYKKRDTAPQDGTITTSITKKRTNIEIQEIEKKPKVDFRRGWQIEAEIPAVMFLRYSYSKSISPRVSVGYLLNHWYVGFIAGYNTFSNTSYYGELSTTDEFIVFGINGRYYFGKGKWTPFVGIRVGGERVNHYYEYHSSVYDDYYNSDFSHNSFFFGADAGFKYYVNNHFAIGLTVPFDLHDLGLPFLGIGVGVSYLF